MRSCFKFLYFTSFAFYLGSAGIKYAKDFSIWIS